MQMMREGPRLCVGGWRWIVTCVTRVAAMPAPAHAPHCTDVTGVPPRRQAPASASRAPFAAA